MRPSHILAVLAATTMLAACAVSHTDGATKAEEVSGGLFGLSTASALDVTTSDAFKGKQQVVIGGFHVAFLKEKHASNKAGGGLFGGGFGGKSSANIDLKGMDAAHFQAITDQAYADFVQRLQAAGYTVVDRSQIALHDDFKGVSSDASPRVEESNFLGMGVTQTVVAPTSIGKIYEGGFGFANPQVGAMGFADKTKIPVLFVNYTVDFANKSGGHGGWGSMSSSVEVGQGISVAPGGGVSFVGGQAGTFSSANGAIKLGQPISSEETFGQMANVSSDAYAAAEAAVNVVGLLSGVGSNQTRAFEITADPARYQAVVAKTLGEANGQLVGKMASLR